MKTQLKILSLLIAMSSLLSSCMFNMFETGNGIISDEERTVPEFSQISSSGSFHIYYEYAETNFVTVTGESNLLKYVETVVDNNELKISTSPHVNLLPHNTIEVYIKSPKIDKIKLSGSGFIHTDAINSNELYLTVSGSGNIETTFYGNDLYTKISGSGKINVYAETDYTESLISGSGKIYIEGETVYSSFKISGSGKVDAYNCETNNADINISGSGNTLLQVNEYLWATISGSGNIHYKGYPQINSHISGSGKLVCEN